MSHASQGDTVRIHYTGKLEDGTILESSCKCTPLELVLGAGQVMGGLERAVHGMEPGECKSVPIPVAEAFGARRADMIFEIDRDCLPVNVDPEIGHEVIIDGREGRPIPVILKAVSESTVTVDANHPLAGRDLVFDLELVEIL